MRRRSERVETKKRVKGAKGRVAARIIAGMMVIFMLIASCSTLIYYLVS